MTKKLGLMVFSLVALSALGYFVTASIKPISTDLTAVGQGTPVLVLAYENFSPTSGEALDRLRDVRADYEPGLQFRVADLGTPQGRTFANRFGLQEGQTAFMRPGGELLMVTVVPTDPQDLRRLLDHKLAALES